MTANKPFEIGGETLSLITASKIAPKPLNYHAIYPQVAGVAGVSGELSAPALTAAFFQQMARLIEYTLPALGTDDDRFNVQTQVLLKAMRQPDADALALKLMLGSFNDRLSFAAEDQAEIRVTLLKLLHLLIENIGELSLDDRWLKGRALEAQEEMRQVLATFIERLSQMTESTSAYYGKLEENSRLIEQAKTLAEITPVLKEVAEATRTMAHECLLARDELRGMREKALVTEAELVQLHQELDRLSAQTRHDPLTGALNRKGLAEAVDREVSNVRRKETPLSMALLDIDNFKVLNDRLGHATGDEALAHLATVTRAVMRPQDTLARYGGEEFVILMPDTPLHNGVEAMSRLQRELTKRFFLSGTEKVLITFSAGVAQLAADETGQNAIKRADQAMYLAKRSGKNRVLGA